MGSQVSLLNYTKRVNIKAPERILHHSYEIIRIYRHWAVPWPTFFKFGHIRSRGVPKLRGFYLQCAFLSKFSSPLAANVDVGSEKS